MVRFVEETLISGVILLVMTMVILGAAVCPKVGLAVAMYLVAFPVLTYISLPLGVPLLVVEILPSLLLISWFHKNPAFGVLAGIVFFVIPFVIQELRRAKRGSGKRLKEKVLRKPKRKTRRATFTKIMGLLGFVPTELCDQLREDLTDYSVLVEALRDQSNRMVPLAIDALDLLEETLILLEDLVRDHNRPEAQKIKILRQRFEVIQESNLINNEVDSRVNSESS
jgi:hypothetical protein